MVLEVEKECSCEMFIDAIATCFNLDTIQHYSYDFGIVYILYFLAGTHFKVAFLIRPLLLSTIKNSMSCSLKLIKTSKIATLTTNQLLIFSNLMSTINIQDVKLSLETSRNIQSINILH